MSAMLLRLDGQELPHDRRLHGGVHEARVEQEHAVDALAQVLVDDDAVIGSVSSSVRVVGQRELRDERLARADDEVARLLARRSRS